MELLLLIALGAVGWVLWKQSRGEDPALGRAFAGCLGMGCLGVVVMFALGVALLWFLLQSLADIDLSLSELFDEPNGGGNNGRDGPTPS